MTGFASLILRISLACFAILFGMMLPAADARATFYTCTTPAGQKVFQDRPCAELAHPEATTVQEKVYPLGMDKSWFKRPEEVDEKPFCDQLGCECGRYAIDYERSLPQALADALFLETLWMNYEMAFADWQMAPANSAELQMQRLLMVEASCALMMSQELLLMYSERVVSKLQERQQEAVEKGFDNPEHCDNGNELACKYYNAVLIYDQILFDVETLKHPRMSLF